MPIWGNTTVLWQSGWDKVNRSRPTHYDIGMSLHYVYGLHRPTTVNVIQYLDRDIYVDKIQCFSCKKNANVKSTLDQMNHKLHSLVFCVPNNFLCIIFFCKIIGNIDVYVSVCILRNKTCYMFVFFIQPPFLGIYLFLFIFIYTTFIKRSIHKQICSNALLN